MTWMAINGDQMKVPATQGARYFDFYHGEGLKPDVRDAGHWLIPFPDRSQRVRSRPRNQRGTKCSTQGCVGEHETAHQHSVGELLA